MSFHITLHNLLNHTKMRQRGVKKGYTTVKQSELSELLKHFHRLDQDARKLDCVNEMFDVLEDAATWLKGWASAETELNAIESVISKCTCAAIFAIASLLYSEISLLLNPSHVRK